MNVPGIKPKSVILCSFVCIVCLVLAGCDPDWPSDSSTCEVVGQVTLDGVALPDAKVVFVPQKLKAGKKSIQVASGITDDRGTFVLEVDSRNRKQIQLDRYRVIISKTVDEKEILHESYNLRSVLECEITTQEAYQRPVFELNSRGTL